MRLPYLSTQNSWVLLEKCEAEISVKKGSIPLLIKRTQMSLILAWTSTVHKN